MNNKVLIIAEAGVNHNGDINLAYKLIDAAKEAGADIVKFQTGLPHNVTSKYAEKAEYQKNTTGNNENQLEMLKKLYLEYTDFDKLKEYCDRRNIIFLSTPFDLESIEVLNKIDMPFWKIPSGEITNYPYLVKIAKTGKPVVMSTGMSNIAEIREAISILNENGCRSIKLLHCNTEYPTPFKDVNLKAIYALKNEFKLEVGYSDHTVGIEVPIAAVSIGATIIEKHFTLDKNMIGPDHKASIEPQELKMMISAIRNIEYALGTEKKIVTESERKNIKIARKSIIAKVDIKKGEVLSELNLITKRPGNGISPMRWNEIIGKKAIRDFNEDELIEV